MGTSKSYDMPSGTNWNSTKNRFTRAAGKVSDSQKPTVPPLIKGFIDSAGGAGSYSRSGKGLSRSNGAIKAGKNLGGFFSDISKEGVDQVFEENFGNRLDGKSTSEVCVELTDFFCKEVEFLNSTDAKTAMYKLLDELLEDAEDLEEIEKIFEEHANDEETTILLRKYFGFYLIEQIERTFYGHLEQRHGADAAKKLIRNDIKTYVVERIHEESKERELLKLNFNQPESIDFIEKILQEVISIYE